ncbi:CRISPR-associated protein Csn1 family [Candidatus Termititenax aidoneus]|uniref:CRISPR-associated protein Csn1 family n=1 Tax=Termititenax aidoneus TaxID=2218524 RepID=A0A388T8G1_TERA1|nr:CRISPR-associated protein Csn1 family [Candidatus Termititenax aidoneus]
MVSKKGKKVFAFDLGKASIGYCVREGLEINEVKSLIIEAEHAEVVSQRTRRRIHKTINSHKKREEFLNKLWIEAGLKILERTDVRFKKEFPAKNEDVVYTSCLLRIALLQNKKMEEWQIYKALHGAIQHRGYDAKADWYNAKNKDEKDNVERAKNYTGGLIKNERYSYPCYYEACRLGLWLENEPNNLQKCVPLNGAQKVRTAGFVAPRELVEKELKQLWENAQKQLPQLRRFTAEYFMYGPSGIAYGAYKNNDFSSYNQIEGVLGQRIPKFNNRIIMKCKLLPKRNVCKAATIENISFVLLMKLKNLRLTISTGDKIILTAEQIKAIYENKLPIWRENLIKLRKDKKPTFSIGSSDIKKVLAEKVVDEIEPLKANIGGRSSFCRTACRIMNKIILAGIDKPGQDLDISEFIDDPKSPNPITDREIKTMLAKIGSWHNLYVPDNRNELQEQASDAREKTDLLIGNITNPIVRNRLQILRDLLLDLKKKYGEPDEMVFEFIRSGIDNSLLASKIAKETEAYQKKQEKCNEELVQKLKRVDAFSGKNLEKLKLLELQNGECVYSGKKIGISDFDRCEIDHIFPRSRGGNDALYNKVLCCKEENQIKKERTPYEWLHTDPERWSIYVARISKLRDKLGKKKFNLLISTPEECAKTIEKYNALAETGQIARAAQSIAAFVFSWGLQTAGDNRRIFVSNGANTAAIRRTYGLNKLLGDDVKKNRANDKHHALDAICISFSRDYKYDAAKRTDEIQNVERGLFKKIVAEAIGNLIPYPYTNDKPFKGNFAPREMIYGKRVGTDGKIYLVKRDVLESVKRDEKSIAYIWDREIRGDLLAKWQSYTNAEWAELLKNYRHPKKQTIVKKVLFIEKADAQVEYDTNGRERIEEFVDFGNKGVHGQFKHSKGQTGRILYYDIQGKIKVWTIYSNQNKQEAKEKMNQQGFKLYRNGEMFYPGCLVYIPQEFRVGKNDYQPGIYKFVRVENSKKGLILLEDNNGLPILTNVGYLAGVNFRRINRTELETIARK